MRGDAPAGRTAKSMSNEVASSASTRVGPWHVGRHGPVASLGSIGFSPVMRLVGLPLPQAE